jgi:predicted SAM-dependent methyltransferase
VRLNIGCGQHYAAGWTNLDLHRDGPLPDIIGSVLALPFENDTVERIYCGHVLEHIGLDELPHALAEIHRVLTTVGELLVVGPDVNLAAVHEPVLVDSVRYGGGRWPGDEHRYVPTGELTLSFIADAGFDARLFPVAGVSDDWPIVARAPWQFAIHANPKEHPCRKHQT